MALTVHVHDRSAADDILRAVYEYDRSAAYTSDLTAVSGSVITAVYRPDESMVEVWSNCVGESSLRDALPAWAREVATVSSLDLRANYEYERHRTTLCPPAM